MIRKVAVIMGSDSDWPVVKGACAQLKALDIPFEAHILSAHRTPAEAAEFARNAKANGFGVILCAAGMAAHLAGAFAANTTLPVIGIPMKGGAMDGLDALLATVQMPSGIPVATVALNGAKNAAWLAAEILALSDDALAGKLDAERAAMAQQIAAKEQKLQKEIEELYCLILHIRCTKSAVCSASMTVPGPRMWQPQPTRLCTLCSTAVRRAAASPSTTMASSPATGISAW